MKMYKLIGARAEKGYTQAYMAEYLNIAKNTYQKKESGKSVFTTKEADLICNLLGKKYEEIFK